MAIEKLPAEYSREPLPPHNTDAEAAVLGGLLIDRDAVARVAAFLRPADFYRERNATIYEAMLALNDRREPVDYLTLSDELQRTGHYDEVGGLVYLSSLFNEVPTSLHVEQYARIVEQASLRRRLIRAAGRIAGLGYDESLEAEKALEEAEQVLFAVAERRLSRDFRKLADVLREYWEQLLLAADVDRLERGIPTSYKDLDKLLGGLQRSDLVIVAARPSMGKALALDTPIPTPRGWMTMKSLQPGDTVFDERGQPCTVLATTEVLYGRQCYEVLFSDGQRVIADADHQWCVETRQTRRDANRPTVIVTTEELARGIHTGDDRLNYSIPLARALQYPMADLPVHPYVLGVWLGDGCSNGARVTVGDEELIDHLTAAGCPTRAERTNRLGKARNYPLSNRSRGGRQSSKLTYLAACEIRGRLASGGASRAVAEQYGVSIGAIQQIGRGRTGSRPDGETSLARRLRELRVLGNKHVPAQYLLASVEQRLALLQGLMDTDGHVDRAGHAEFCTISPALASSVLELVTGLGMSPRLHVDRATLNGVDHGPRYRVRFLPTDYPVFRLSRKASRQRRVSSLARARRRYVVRVSPVPSVPVRCIQVDSPSRLYLAGTGGIPTHNSSFALCLARNAAVDFGAKVGIFSLEMSLAQLAQRLLFSESGVDSSRLRQGILGQTERRKLADALGTLASAPIYLDDSPNIALSELRAKSRRLHQELGGLDLLVVDYLQLIQGSGKDNRVNEISEISRSLKALARELDVPVVALSQLSRAVESRSPHIPMLSDLRESGSIEQDADVVMFIYREEVYERDTENKGIAEIHVAKHRNGPTGQVSLLWLEKLTKFVDLGVER
jgi:replicative DNA helicase